MGGAGALACTTPARAVALTADLSWVRFEGKWGALPVALWLADEQARDPGALRRFVVEGPDGVWGLAGRHLPPELAAALNEAKLAAELCR